TLGLRARPWRREQQQPQLRPYQKHRNGDGSSVCVLDRVLLLAMLRCFTSIHHHHQPPAVRKRACPTSMLCALFYHYSSSSSQPLSKNSPVKNDRDRTTHDQARTPWRHRRVARPTSPAIPSSSPFGLDRHHQQ
ncbi:unnamed protein product, partial [Laminaria digitata]